MRFCGIRWHINGRFNVIKIKIKVYQANRIPAQTIQNEEAKEAIRLYSTVKKKKKKRA